MNKNEKKNNQRFIFQIINGAIRVAYKWNTQVSKNMKNFKILKKLYFSFSSFLLIKIEKSTK